MRTGVEGSRELESTDELRVEARSNLNTHAAAKKPDVHYSQIRFLPPPHFVLRHHAGDDRVGSTILSFDETHNGDVRSDESYDAFEDVWEVCVLYSKGTEGPATPALYPGHSVVRVG